MKRILFLLIVTMVALASCDKDTTDIGIVGKWLVKEHYADPGNGSGTWQKVTDVPPPYITFRPDSTVKSSYDTFGLDGMLRYSIRDSNRIVFTFKNKSSITYWYKIEGKTLTLNPPCIEGCGIRLERK